MGSPSPIFRITPVAFALAILGAAEILVVDISANLIYVLPISASGFFIAITAFVLFLSFLFLSWEAAKSRRAKGIGFADGIKNGILMGLSPAIFICAMLLATAALGRGFERFAPLAAVGELGMKAAFYAIICASVLLIYCAIGAAAGAMAGIFLELMNKETESGEAAKAR
jgi:hypothetical protein